MSNNYITKQTTDSTLNLEEFTKCYICLCKIQDASMCPNCQKISCQRCIQKWLMERKNQCPHCRRPLKLSQIINIRFINELSNILENINSSKKQNNSEICKEHNINILYFCVDCNDSLCSDCYMFGKKHKDHEINKLDQIYSNHVEIIRNESKEIQRKFDQLNSYLKAINDKIISIGSYKLEKSNELEELFDSLKNKLENKVHLKLTKMMQYKNEISDKLKFLDGIRFSIEKELTEAPKSILISKSDELVKNLKNLNIDSSLDTKILDNINLNISTEIPSDILPQYESAIFIINDYKKLLANGNNSLTNSTGNAPSQNNNTVESNKINNTARGVSPILNSNKDKEIVYSPELITNGLVWRLKVYPNGNGAAKGEYISTFLELIEGLFETSKYYYRIELINYNYSVGDKRHSHHGREFSSDFTNGECWGYNRFYKIDNLEREGFLDPKGNLTIKFYVRPQTFSQLCRDQKIYINSLEKQIKYLIDSNPDNKSNVQNDLEQTNKNSEGCATQNNFNINAKENISNVEDKITNNTNIIINSINNNVNNIEALHFIGESDCKENIINENISNIKNTFNEETKEFAKICDKQEINNANQRFEDEINMNSNKSNPHMISNIILTNKNLKTKINKNTNNKDISIINKDEIKDYQNSHEIEQDVVITEINNINEINIKSPRDLVLKANLISNDNRNDNFVKPKLFKNDQFQANSNRLVNSQIISKPSLNLISGSNKYDLNNKKPSKVFVNFDTYEADLSFDNSSRDNIIANLNRSNSNKYLNNSMNNENHIADTNCIIQPKKTGNISDDGSSFGSLMDSIKLIEDASLNEKNMKFLKKIEKDEFGFANGLNTDNSKIRNNFFKNNIVDKEKFSPPENNENMYNLYPENSFNFQKSNYKKYAQAGFQNSNKGLTSNLLKSNMNPSYNKSSTQNINSASNSVNVMFNHDFGEMTQEYFKKTSFNLGKNNK